MNRQRETAVVVLEKRRICGIFTERDVLTRVLPIIDGMFVPISELMTQRPHVLSQSSLLLSALRILALGPYHHLPVVDENDTLVGLVTLHTIASFLLENFAEIMLAPPERESFPPVSDGA